MGHFARMFFIGIISTAASCSQLAQKDEDRMRTSFASRRPTMVDRNMAIDQAFTVCKTEEGKLQTFENALSESQNGNNSAILAHRNKLREELSR